MYCMLEKNIFESGDNIEISSGREKKSGQDQSTNMPTYLPIILTTCIAYLLTYIPTYLLIRLLTYYLIILNYKQDSYIYSCSIPDPYQIPYRVFHFTITGQNCSERLKPAGAKLLNDR